MEKDTNLTTGHDFVIKDVSIDDIDDVCKLGAMLNTINLPAKKSDLEIVIKTSEKSFSLREKDATRRAFLFGLTNVEGRVIGTSQIFAKHGTLEYPHIYFQVSLDERYSDTLKKYFRHKTLRLTQSFDGPTEIGSLVIDQEYRSMPQKLGRNLSYVRFLFMAMKPQLFASRILAELLPPLGPKFESAMWDAIGRKFTGLDYYEADMISRKNKEFITSLFPSHEIHAALLPSEAQEVIGQVGRNSKGAAHLLSKIGFRYSHRVDPFDGGPHFEADQSEISLLNNSIKGLAHKSHDLVPRSDREQLLVGLVGRFRPNEKSGHRFSATLAAYRYEHEEKRVSLHEKTFEALELSEEEEIFLIDMTH